MTARLRVIVFPLALLAVAAAFGGAGARAATPTPPAGLAKLAACMKGKGLTFPPASQADLAKASYRTAMQVCAKQTGTNLGAPAGARPAGSSPQNLQKYATCMKQHGVNINPTSGNRPDRSSKAFKTANAACAKQLRG